ncbi:mechanosensitive ion channel family protein [Paenibacillus abyssi]|uniref:Mechanosensitive ion channel protein MscS n=1 Tax=Paenibacillus abyssi TaxID=1340531 RepID=A0A917G7K8_9BACL|nr:mechanosensitive ion channel family protein [Paenibacillus abyssi]GGG26849.1 mechanosensitive ion channel protein MscS [Paenibacillus abyssi]
MMWFNEAINDITAWLSNEVMWKNLALTALRILIILIAARIVIFIVHKAITHAIIERESKRLAIQTRRMRTVGKLLKNVSSYVVHFITILLVFSEFNIHLGPLLAGAGVIGLAIGFGAQSLVKDVITGFFIILEDQFAVGDVVQTGAFKGTVEMIGLRSTRLQSWTGEVHIIPNGMINEVTNFSINNSLAVVDISIAYEEDIDEAEQVIRQTVAKVEDENLVRQPEVLGIQMLGASEVVLRVIAECRPNAQHGYTRKLRSEIKKALDAHNIEIPYPKQVQLHRSEKDGGGVKSGA